MKVTVKMIGGFVHTAGFSEKTLELPPGSTTDTLLDMLKIDPSRPKVVARNGSAVIVAERLEEGDRVVISPVFSGG